MFDKITGEKGIWTIIQRLGIALHELSFFLTTFPHFFKLQKIRKREKKKKALVCIPQTVAYTKRRIYQLYGKTIGKPIGFSRWSLKQRKEIAWKPGKYTSEGIFMKKGKKEEK